MAYRLLQAGFGVPAPPVRRELQNRLRRLGFKEDVLSLLVERAIGFLSWPSESPLLIALDFWSASALAHSY